jgi:hypothetical protein
VSRAKPAREDAPENAPKGRSMAKPKNLREAIDEILREIYDDVKYKRTAIPVETSDDALKYALSRIKMKGPEIGLGEWDIHEQITLWALKVRFDAMREKDETPPALWNR